jgi:putative hemolysin
MVGIEWIVIAGMILLNSVFAAYEIALASVSLARLQLLVRENRPGASVSLYMKENMEASLAVIQLGITLVGATAGATGGASATETIAPVFEGLGLAPGLAEFLAIAIVVLPLSVVTIVVGELVPKVFALRNKEWVCLRLSPAMRWFAFATWPAVWLFEALVMAVMDWGETRWQARIDTHHKSEAAELQELRAVAALARTARLIGGHEEKIILQAVGLSVRPVSEIMLPAEHITTLTAGDSMAESLVKAHLDMHTRFPVCERAGDPQSIVGYVNFKDVVAQLRLSPREPSLRAILRPILSLAASLPLSACLERLMREHSHIALVTDDGGRIVGMVSLEDILEELVGEIQDEYDRLPAHVVRSGSAWVVGGGVDLSKLSSVTSIDLQADSPAGEARTLNDWVVGHLERDLKGGEIVERRGVRVLVRKVRRNKLLEAQVGPAPGAAPTP